MRATLAAKPKPAIGELLAAVRVPEGSGGGLVLVGLSVLAGFGAATGGLPYSAEAFVPVLVSVAAAVAGVGMCRRMRRARRTLVHYVPESVAQRILEGSEPAEGEREVSVLFVDLCRYTSRVEKLSPIEIHLLLGRYTMCVSRIIHRHGGSVVEFGGDGLLAVFGAPESLAHKERAALAASRAIVSAVGKIEEPGEARLDVGIGLATGPVFLGMMPSVGRAIWSVVGNTTNLAARLQALTRELHVPIAVDEVTWERAGHPGLLAGVHRGLSIRGRIKGENVYTVRSPQSDGPAAPSAGTAAVGERGGARLPVPYPPATSQTTASA